MSEEEAVDLKDALDGVDFMIKGLEYHFENFLRLSSKLSKINESGSPEPMNMESDSKIIDKMKHETIAYLNRMGQIYFFARSPVINELVGQPEKTIPTLCKFLPFRHKHASHRAIDYPKGENIFYMRQLNMIFSSVSARSNNDLVFYLHDENPENLLELNLLEEHFQIKYESINLVKYLFDCCKQKPFSFDPSIFADNVKMERFLSMPCIPTK